MDEEVRCVLTSRTGVYVSFAEALDLCLRHSLPLVFGALSMFAIALASGSSQGPEVVSRGFFHWRGNATESLTEFTKNDLLLGSPDPFFWFLVPLFGIVSIGGCIVINYIALGLIHAFAFVYSILVARPGWVRNEDRRCAANGRSLAFSLSPVLRQLSDCVLLLCRKYAGPVFCATSPARRVATASVLLLLVSTIIPYQFAFLVACIVQIASCTRALKLARDTVSNARSTAQVGVLMADSSDPSRVLALGRSLVFLQLRPLDFHAHALDPPD